MIPDRSEAISIESSIETSGDGMRAGNGGSDISIGDTTDDENVADDTDDLEDGETMDID
jgi:hypothetical protein